jgi:hypothetical protein
MIVKENAELSAFPWVCYDLRIIAKGMTLRDYFAAKAMLGVLSAGNLPHDLKDKVIAKKCYEMADAMMKAREQ